MNLFFRQTLVVITAISLLASCSSNKKATGTSRSGKVVIVDGKTIRVGTVAKKDNGLHKGWYKNPNNPHHPNTTNPGHTKKKGKGKPGKKK